MKLLKFIVLLLFLTLPLNSSGVEYQSSAPPAKLSPWNGTRGADIASVAGVTNIAAATGNYVEITGTNTITGFGAITAGAIRFVRFTGVLTITYNATSLILPGARNIITGAGDRAIFISLGSGNWVCQEFLKADGRGG